VTGAGSLPMHLQPADLIKGAGLGLIVLRKCILDFSRICHARREQPGFVAVPRSAIGAGIGIYFPHIGREISVAMICQPTHLILHNHNYPRSGENKWRN
jgi:hypothetical protein